MKSENTHGGQAHEVYHAVYQCFNLDIHFLVPFFLYGIQILVGVLVDCGLARPRKEVCAWKRRRPRDIGLWYIRHAVNGL